MTSAAETASPLPRREVHERLINRELSWVDYAARVLARAEDEGSPLLERTKFLAIFASILDEFYMVRIAGLKRQLAAGLVVRSSEGQTPREQLRALAQRLAPLVAHHAEIFCRDVLPRLGDEGIRIERWKELDPEARRGLTEMFSRQIFPVLTPLAVDPGHPFPYISNLSLNLAVRVRDRSSDQLHFARVKVPPVLPRLVTAAESGCLVPLEDVIAAHLDRLFPGMDIVEHHAFRVTRNADLEINDDGAEDLLQALEEELVRRRFSPAVRLEIETDMSPHVLEVLRKELEVEPLDVHRLPGPLDLGGLMGLYDVERPDLKDDPISPATHRDLMAVDEAPVDMFGALRARDVLVQHPYHSFATSVERLIEQASSDPNVLAIKQTLYRTSGDSPVVDKLIDAAEAGKQVVVLVEIKARFDERANIGWARALEKAGCHVVYGLVGLKTHAKLLLIVRQEKGKLHRYAHIGTGNYNHKTARSYEDLGLLTADDELCAEVGELFNYLTGYSRRPEYRHLIVAPEDMRERIISLIARESSASSAEPRRHLAMKVNSLVDERVINALYDASQAGVEIDLLVRGICCLRPGIEGLSENVRVHSIVGRWLEHSRIFYFHNGGNEEWFIGSADLMPRNLDGRVEALVRVDAPSLKDELTFLFDVGFRDNVNAWSLDAEGNWSRVKAQDGAERVDMQQMLMQRATRHA
ncbi:MAG: RNA degradosome polyphosphate kinase [Actinomycetota bacterium]